MVNIKIGNDNYSLRLSTKDVVAMESKLGDNPLNVFMKASNGSLPKIGELMIMFHACLQSLNHGISLDKTYDLYDEYCANGGSIVSLIECIADVFKDSGYIPEDTGKN